MNPSSVALLSFILNEIVNMLKQLVGEFGSGILIILAVHFCRSTFLVKRKSFKVKWELFMCPCHLKEISLQFSQWYTVDESKLLAED